MGDIFRSSEALAQDGALNDYANRLRKGEEKRAEENEKIADFNERLRGITDPISMVIGGKPLEKVVQSGLKKALGQGAKAVESKLSEKLSQFVAGNQSLHESLPSNVSRSIKAVLGDSPPQEVSSAFKNLSFKARQTINQARERLGKRPISLNPEQSSPVSATDTPSNVEDEAFRPTDETEVPGRIPPPDFGEETGGGFVEDDALGSVGGTGEPAGSLSDRAQTQDLPSEEGEAPNSTSQGSAEVSDPNNSLGGIVNSTETPTANASEVSGSSTGELGTDNVASTAGADADEAVSGLGEVADVLDATAVAQGGADIFSDILAGFASLATLIGGEAGAKAPVSQGTTPLGSAIQYGV